MELNSTKISQIQTVLIDDESIDFTEDNFSKGSWYISNSDILRFGAEDKNGETEIEKTFSGSPGDRPYSEFYEKIKGKDFKARIFLGHSAGKEKYKVYYNWEELAKALGISELVTLSTKIPKVMARRFTIFANQQGDRSSVLRGLIYNYVKKQMVEQIDSLMFKENI